MKGIFVVRIGLCKATIQRVFADGQHNSFAFATDDSCCHKSEVFKLCQRLLLAVAEFAAALFKDGALASDGSLGDKKIRVLRQSDICWNTITCGE